ncbi:exodeoxyribonuclease III, partial [Ruminococcaceae bacterium OttesenSCG-928-O06]|nr:exodeoxyribonuclease III [Ruminococcaceae bacterium OttesenSCG-928-O06]
MRMISWNVNGFRAVLKNGFAGVFAQFGADFFCIQETKMQPGQATFEPEGYYQYWHSAEKKGYSGTAVFAKHKPKEVFYGLGLDVHNDEGRAITLEYADFYLVNVYTPNAQPNLKRIGYRTCWEDDLRDYLTGLDEVKPVVYCGDLNVAHNEIDLRNPGPNRGNAGFSDEEREKMTQLLASGFCDTYRALYPDKTGAYTWWSYRGAARANNTGWRIDYFIVSDRLMPLVEDSLIYPEVTGSDHCP